MGTDPEPLAGLDDERLSALIRAACDSAELPVVITVSDLDPPQNLFLNRGAEKLLGYSLSEFRAISVWDWIAPEDPAPQRGRILVVDDEFSVARTLAALLQSEHDITLAASGAEALAAIEAEPNHGFDVIMCDLMMPGMSGMDLYERVKREHAGLELRMVAALGRGRAPRERWLTRFMAAAERARTRHRVRPFGCSRRERTRSATCSSLP